MLAPVETIYRLDMDLRGYWMWWSPRRGNFPDAIAWAVERAGEVVPAWLEACRAAGRPGQVAALGHSGGTLAITAMLGRGLPLDAAVLWSCGRRQRWMNRLLDRRPMDEARLLIVSSDGDMAGWQWQLFWPSQAYGRALAEGRNRWQALHVADRRCHHPGLLTLGEDEWPLIGTLPGLSRGEPRPGSPNELVRRFLLDALDPGRPALFLTLGGTDTEYEEGSPAWYIERCVVGPVAQARAGRPVEVTIPRNQRQEQAEGRWRPGRARWRA